MSMTMITPKRYDGYVELDVSGKLTRRDYDALLPRIEQAIDEHDGKLRMLIELHDFHGWTPTAFVDDLRFDVRHHDDFDRIAIVGEKTVEKVGTKLSAPFFDGDVRFFDDPTEARSWLS